MRKTQLNGERNIRAGNTGCINNKINEIQNVLMERKRDRDVLIQTKKNRRLWKTI